MCCSIDGVTQCIVGGTGDYSSLPTSRMKMVISQVNDCHRFRRDALPVSPLTSLGRPVAAAAQRPQSELSMHPVSSPPAGVHGSNQQRLERSMDLLDRNPWFLSLSHAHTRSVYVCVRIIAPFSNPRHQSVTLPPAWALAFTPERTAGPQEGRTHMNPERCHMQLQDLGTLQGHSGI